MALVHSWEMDGLSQEEIDVLFADGEVPLVQAVAISSPRPCYSRTSTMTRCCMTRIRARAWWW
jgi:hypothetical protein